MDPMYKTVQQCIDDNARRVEEQADGPSPLERLARAAERIADALEEQGRWHYGNGGIVYRTCRACGSMYTSIGNGRWEPAYSGAPGCPRCKEESRDGEE